MSTVTIVLLVILVILIGVLIGLYFFGKKAQKKQEEQQAQIEASKQTISMLVIDKKRMPLKESGLPQMVIDQTPKLMRRSKLPIVKAKVGPKISILIADEKVFDLIPVKKEIKAEVSGLYIVGVKGTPWFSGSSGSEKERVLRPFQKEQIINSKIKKGCCCHSSLSYFFACTGRHTCYKVNFLQSFGCAWIARQQSATCSWFISSA